MMARARVKSLPSELSGRGLVRVDARTASLLEVEAGDYVEIVGRSKTAAALIVLGPNKTPIAEIDRLIAQNAGVDVGGEAVLKRASPRMASVLVLMPENPLLARKLKLNPVAVRRRLEGYAVVKGNGIRSSVRGVGILSATVVDTFPSGVVIVDGNTDVVIREPGDLSKAVNRATFGDIGGMKPQIEALRERVVSPFRDTAAYERFDIPLPRGCFSMVLRASGRPFSLGPWRTSWSRSTSRR